MIAPLVMHVCFSAIADGHRSVHMVPLCGLDAFRFAI